MSTVFLCHCIADKDIVSQLKLSLEAQGIQARDDSRVIRSGDTLPPHTKETLSNAQAFVLILSPTASESAWVQSETMQAIVLHRARGAGFPIIPILLNGAELGALKWIFTESIQPIILEPDKELTSLIPQIIYEVGKAKKALEQSNLDAHKEPEIEQ